jgi:hypothetical protein
MKFGMRMPSLKGRISARTSWKRYVRHSMGVKAPRGWGWLTNPKKALYNRIYNRTTFSIDSLFKGVGRGRKAGAGKKGPGVGCLAVVIIVLGLIKLLS